MQKLPVVFLKLLKPVTFNESILKSPIAAIIFSDLGNGKDREDLRYILT